MGKCLQAFCKILFCLLALKLIGPGKISRVFETLHRHEDLLKSPATTLARSLSLEAPPFYAEHFDKKVRTVTGLRKFLV